jgi:hypothetical protein
VDDLVRLDVGDARVIRQRRRTRRAQPNGEALEGVLVDEPDRAAVRARELPRRLADERPLRASLACGADRIRLEDDDVGTGDGIRRCAHLACGRRRRHSETHEQPDKKGSDHSWPPLGCLTKGEVKAIVAFVSTSLPVGITPSAAPA